MRLRHYSVSFLAFVLLALVEPLPALSSDTVRVLLFEEVRPTSVVISGHGGGLRLFAGDYDDELVRLDEGEEAVLSRGSDQVHLRIGDLKLFAHSLRVEPDAGAHVSVRVQEGSTAAGPHRYSGKLFVRGNESAWELDLINEVGLEDYVAAVISREYGLDDLEGTKAMAVVIRTYAIKSAGRFGDGYNHVDHTLSQVYQGVDGVTPLIRQAVQETRGQILTHDGEPIQAVYFSASGGNTADNESVWNAEAQPYLRGKADPYGAASPHWEWTTRVSRPQLLRALSGKYGFDVAGIRVADRSGEGRVTRLHLLREDGSTQAVRANDFRLLVISTFGVSTLRSTFFDVRRIGDEYEFEGRGYGHGVGMSQWGAHDLAKRGRSYREILDFYYTGVALATLADGPGNEQELAASEEAPTEQIREAEATPEASAHRPGSRRIGW